MNDATFVFHFLDFITVVETNTTVLDGVEMVVVGVLVESNEGIGLVSWMEDFAGAEVDLENGRTARDRAGNGHVSHDLLSGGAS